MSECSNTKRILESASASIDDASLRCGSVPSPPATKRSRKRQKKDAKQIDKAESENQTNPMGYTKIKVLSSIADSTSFMEHLNLAKHSFLSQFDTKHKLGLDHLGFIADCLIRIKAFPQPQQNDWCTLIDAKIAEFLKIQIIPNVIPELKLSQEVYEKFKRFDKINEYFGRLNANENHQVMQPTTSARANESIETVPIPMDVDVDVGTDEDYRMISLIPTTSDIDCCYTPFIEKNILNGKYDNVSHYLDLQFRLFRADFIQPLRSDIERYRRYSKSTLTKSIKGLKLYRRIKMLNARVSHNGFMCKCKFSVQEQWQQNRNKTIMPGSLMCFSSNNFESFFFGTLSHGSSQEFSEGRFNVCLEGSSSIPDCDMLYDMIEAPAYFEAYRYNLKVLQGLNEENFPFKKYIVDVETNISPPSYLSDNPVYTISNGLPASNPESKEFTVKILSEETWPTSNELHMDQSQYDAYFAALTKQLAIIQGPPGKLSYVFLHIQSIEILFNC